ncbi:hypothetical protein F443_19920 [Phytophthora nicotianae P1569]|uniref:Uncharacterized protein n=2 Tax=Phytophthora nicotianae TaxID=4792 RepID=V9E2X0_PHYNI|nr:hypothetical protein F443_19920 [Phytophthora nicotianae P1569]
MLRRRCINNCSCRRAIGLEPDFAFILEFVCALPVEEDIFKAQDTTSDTHQGDEDLDNCLGVHFTQEFKNKPPGD